MAAAAVVPSGPPAPPSGEPPPVACPQCGNFWGVGSLFVRDTCGHRKCRGCVIVEGNECGTCSLRAGGGGGSSRPATEPSSEPPAKETAGAPVSNNEATTSRAATGPTPATEALPSGAQPVDRKVRPSPSNVTASSNKKKDPPQQSAGKKVLDELNVTNANNVAELACEDSADAEAVDDPDELPEAGVPAAKRPPPPTHGVIKLPGLPVTYCCTICGHKFKSRSTVRYHYYCGVENKPLTCELCKKGFVSKSHYQYHMRDHAGDSPFKCDVCGKGFKQKAKLKRHTIVHTDDRKFECSTCGKHFAEASNLKVHSRLHTGERPYKCEHCERSFNERANYIKHVRSIHTNERPYACEMCGKCFARSENLKVHLRRHKGIRPYECPVCSLTFSYKKDMTRHMSVHDSSVRPFECDKCSQTFKRKDNLLRHIKLSHNDNEKDEESQNVAGEKSAEAETPPLRETSAVTPREAGTLEPGVENTKENMREEVNKSATPQSSTTSESVPTNSSIVPSLVDEAAYQQSKPGTDKQPPGTSTACGNTSDSDSGRPPRKRRVRVPPDPTACSSLPVFRRNVTPPPGALPDPPRVPRHCLPAPRERHAVLRPPVPVDFLETTGDKKTPRSRSTGRKRLKRELETDTTDIEKVGFIQVPQYPPKPQPNPQPAPAQTKEATPSSADSRPKAAETCGAVPVIKRPQPSNCVRTITKTPQRAVSTIVSPRNCEPAPKPVHTAPPLPPLPACSPRPDQPMLRLLLHDTPCSDSLQPPPAPAPVRAETPPPPPTATHRPAEGFGLCDVYECILKGNLGQLTGGRQNSTGRHTVSEWHIPAAGTPAVPQNRHPPFCPRETPVVLPRESCGVAQKLVPVSQDIPVTAVRRVPTAEKQLGTGRSGTAEVQSAAVEDNETVAPKEVAFAHGHFHTVQQSYREQHHPQVQLPLWPSVTSLSKEKGKQKRAVDGEQAVSEDGTYVDTYCSFVRIRAKKQTVFCEKKSGKSTFVEEEQGHSAYTEVRRPGKRMSAISDRLSDDNEEDDEGALNYTLYSCGSGGKRIPDSYSPDDPFPRDYYRVPHHGSRGEKTFDVLDVIAQLRDCAADRGVPHGSGGVEATDVARSLPVPRDLSAPSSVQQPHVIVGTGKLSDVPYS